MTLRVGQKVVCVNAKNWRSPHLLHLSSALPVEGQIYTVRGFTPGGMLLLEEIISAPHSWLWGRGEGGWMPRRFRPVVERKTDISIFTEMLGPQRELVSLTTGKCE